MVKIQAKDIQDLKQFVQKLNEKIQQSDERIRQNENTYKLINRSYGKLNLTFYKPCRNCNYSTWGKRVLSSILNF